MAAVQLTETAIRAALKRAASAGTREDLSDKALPGLRLRVTPKGRGSWVLACRDGVGAMRRFQLGAYPALGVGEAREAARRERVRVRQGRDPIRERREAAQAARVRGERDRLTLGVLVEDWRRERLIHRSPRYAHEAVRALKVAFSAEWERPAEALDRAGVLRVLDGIARRRTAHRGNATDRNPMAARTAAYGRACFTWALKRDMVPTNPFEILPDRPAAPTREHVLSDDELAGVWAAASAMDGAFGRMVRILILTGQRRDEVAGIRWEELSADLATWTIPGSRTKNGRPQLVPLSPMARDVLADLDRGKGLVFPSKAAKAAVEADRGAKSGAGETTFSAWSKAKARLDNAIADARAREAQARRVEPELLAPWRLHDLRRTLATGLQRLGVRLEVTEAMLNHVSGTRAGIVGVYQRHDWATEKRAAINAWAVHLQSVLEGREGAGAGEALVLRQA